MGSDYILKMSVEALWLVVLISAPPILAAAIAGLTVAILQSATQVQEQTIQYAIKLAAVIVALMLSLHLIVAAIYSFGSRVFLELAVAA